MNESATNVFSPPLKISRELIFLPLGLASMLIPPSKGLSGRSSIIFAEPPGDNF